MSAQLATQDLSYSSTPAPARLPDNASASLEYETTRAPLLYDAQLYTAAQYLDDLEGLRKAHPNRLRILITSEPDEDGVLRGHGYPVDHPVAESVRAQIEQISALEAGAVLSLKRAMRKHPLDAWRRTRKGVGEKTLARLLAVIGDPYVRYDGQVRTVSQLWAYCGMHVRDGEAARLRKGVQANWRTDAKTRLWNVVQPCTKQLMATCKTDYGIGEHVEGCACSPYRVLIDERRLHTAVTRPDWTPAHSLADAQRVAGKALLKHLWRAARDYHLEQSA